MANFIPDEGKFIDYLSFCLKKERIKLLGKLLNTFRKSEILILCDPLIYLLNKIYLYKKNIH